MVSQWNLGGQNIDTLGIILRESDLITVQEVARDEPGWTEHNNDDFYWLLHRHESHYRGVGIGIAQDLLDCVVEKVASDRGMWALLRVKGLGRVVLGSLHCHTGATQRTYASSVHQFFNTFKRKWKGYPVVLGVDVNEVPTWQHGDDEDFHIVNTNVNIESLLEEASHLGMKAVTPVDRDLLTPTHYPRDPTRRGRQIDMLFVKSLSTTRSKIRPDLRHCIGSDHAEMNCELLTAGTRFQKWGEDTRPRILSDFLPNDGIIVDSADLRHLAQTCTRPVKSPAYVDPPEVKELIAAARSSKDVAQWKKVHKARRKARKDWHKERATAVLHGDWSAYRSYQRDRKKKKGWWGRMLVDRSAADLTAQVQAHLKTKMTDPAIKEWDDVLRAKIGGVVLADCWQPYTKEEIFETLSQMRPRTAVGSDLICVDLLKAVTLHEQLGDQLVSLVNHIVEHNQQPVEWGVSILALLAKCNEPMGPGDLRPICIGSNFAKLTNRLVMNRVFPALRRGSMCSTCGKGRQVADCVGVMTRLRDMLHEWREPMLIAKLDVAAAFDRLSRTAVADLLLQRTAGKGIDHEVRYMLKQLEENQLVGTVPGGGEIDFRANVGIRQGAPESAELFGLVMGLLLDKAMTKREWVEIGTPLQDLDVELLYFQDDVFLFETTASRLARKIGLVGDALLEGGLRLAMNKTKIVATPDYKGRRKVEIEGEVVNVLADDSIKVLGVSFNFAGPSSQQAEELLGRARGAFEEHKQLLRAKGPWINKAHMVSMLITSTWRWVAGAVHWSKESLAKANTLQAQVLRSAFRMGRWNKRTLRDIRSFLHRHNIPRWSTVALTMQHQLLGHWARRVEVLEDGSSVPGVTMRSLSWRNLQWWEHQKALTTTGKRHPRAFYPANMERQVALAIGTDWPAKTADRNKWRETLATFLEKTDVRWASGRQCAITM